MRNLLDYIDWFKTPETGEGSQWDRSKYRKNPISTLLYGGEIASNPSPLSKNIKEIAYSNIGIDTFRGKRNSYVCADAVCDIYSIVGIPWPKDKKGNPASTVDFVIDAFDGRGNPGKLFEKYSEDFKHVGPGELGIGDILILGEDQKHMTIITGIYEDGVEVVHDRGQDEPKSSKFYSFDWVTDMFNRAYRYTPDLDDEAFSHLIYKSNE